jgi:hypothetical protein
VNVNTTGGGGRVSRYRAKRQVQPESAYVAEVRQELSDSQLADLLQRRAEEFASAQELERVVEPGDCAEVAA